ncbi:conserved Plasmodium protein, unknown function [Plasmodium relictum]|uniref:CHCH domain-containing protein n=1 Tax=Plasmodium relictum TaxID=85471 RepID=A0A1J1HCU6_PLARL|nr:conserved Plasmodium protein, unknown function [Plasmodium relictum]CRH02776.1 conserved Plasmodium protein, unknown function [Plasmodium relictum]
MGRSSRSRSNSLSTRSSFVKRSGSNDMHRGSNTSAQNYSGNLMQQQNSGKSGFLSNMMGTVASGMASGVGFGVAQRAVDSILGPRHVEVSHTNNNAQMNQAAAMNSERNMHKCQPYMDELNQCLMRHSDVSLCQNYADSLKSCQQSM